MAVLFGRWERPAMWMWVKLLWVLACRPQKPHQSGLFNNVSGDKVLYFPFPSCFCIELALVWKGKKKKKGSWESAKAVVFAVSLKKSRKALFIYLDIFRTPPWLHAFDETLTEPDRKPCWDFSCGFHRLWIRCWGISWWRVSSGPTGTTAFASAEEEGTPTHSLSGNVAYVDRT